MSAIGTEKASPASLAMSVDAGGPEYRARRHVHMLTCGYVGAARGAIAAVSCALFLLQAAYLFRRAVRFSILIVRFLPCRTR